jgi:hypothetical protein
MEHNAKRLRFDIAKQPRQLSMASFMYSGDAGRHAGYDVPALPLNPPIRDAF